MRKPDVRGQESRGNCDRVLIGFDTAADAGPKKLVGLGRRAETPTAV